MIKFFRKIRQKLLTENKFSKYLLYAIGEIVLVMIGILLALQVNNWNTSKNNTQKEQIYLTSYRDDIKTNLKELNRVIKKSRFAIDAADSLLRYTQSQLDINSIIKVEEVIMESSNYTIFISQEGTINDIFGSGNLALIKNDSIRKSMVNWAAELKYLREYETLGKDNQLQFISYLKRKTPIYKLSLRQSFIDKEVMEKITKDLDFLNLVGEQKHMATVLNGLYSEQETKMKILLTLIETNIE